MDLLQVASQRGTPITIVELATLAAVERILVLVMLTAELMVRTWVVQQWVTLRQRLGWVVDMDQQQAPWEDMDQQVQRTMDERLIMGVQTLAQEQIMVIIMMDEICTI
jgi:hypothetical protein